MSETDVFMVVYKINLTITLTAALFAWLERVIHWEIKCTMGIGSWGISIAYLRTPENKLILSVRKRFCRLQICSIVLISLLDFFVSTETNAETTYEC